MSTFSANVTLKANAAVAAVATANGTLYTAPAGGYAIINIAAAKTGGGLISIGGRAVFNNVQVAGQTDYHVPGDYFPAGVATPGYSSRQGIYVGPGQAVVLTGAVGTVSFEISGVEFINTP